jgi:dynein heavy chain
VAKALQLAATLESRHGVMLVGATGAGKTATRRALVRALGRLAADEQQQQLASGGSSTTNSSRSQQWRKVHVRALNPGALAASELYGAADPATGEWRDGVLARAVRDACREGEAEASLDQWVVLDGPVTSQWAETLNSVLDDSRVLTLLSGERILLPPRARVLFEVDSLAAASPATVSRAGMVYMHAPDLGWQPFVASWLAQRAALASSQGKSSSADAGDVAVLTELAERFFDAALDVRARCKKDGLELAPIDALSAVRNTTRLFDALLPPVPAAAAAAAVASASEQQSPRDAAGGRDQCDDDKAGAAASSDANSGGDDDNDGNGDDSAAEARRSLVELWFMFALAWSVGGSLDLEGRRRFNGFMREMDTRYPSAGSVFDYVVDPQKRGWAHFEAGLQAAAAFRAPPGVPLHRCVAVDGKDFLLLFHLFLNRIPTTGHDNTTKTTKQQSPRADDRHRAHPLCGRRAAARWAPHARRRAAGQRQDRRAHVLARGAAGGRLVNVPADARGLLDERVAAGRARIANGAPQQGRLHAARRPHLDRLCRRLERAAAGQRRHRGHPRAAAPLGRGGRVV